MAINLGNIKIGQKYEFPVYKEVSGTFAATKSETILFDGGEVDIYYDQNHTQKLVKDGPTPELHFTGFGNGGKLTFNVEAGKKYYFWSGKRGCMNSQYILLTSLANLEIVSITPPEGSIFEITGYGSSNITFNQPVKYESAFISFSTLTIPVTPRISGSSINVELKNELWKLYKKGMITGEGQNFALTIKGIKSDASTLYNNDGTLCVNYYTCERPISLTNVQSPSIFRPLFDKEDKDSVVVLTFDSKLSSKPPGVELYYGSREAFDFYTEKLNATVEGNKILVELFGKRREPKDMVRSGKVYSTVSIKANNVRDAKGNVAWSDEQGSVGSFTINIPYQV